MVRLFKHYVPHAVLLLGLVDVLLLLAANNLAWTLRAAQIGMNPGPLIERLPTLAIVSITTMLAMVAVGVFGPDSLRSMRFAAARADRAEVVAAAASRSPSSASADSSPEQAAALPRARAKDLASRPASESRSATSKPKS